MVDKSLHEVLPLCVHYFLQLHDLQVLEPQFFLELLDNVLLLIHGHCYLLLYELKFILILDLDHFYFVVCFAEPVLCVLSRPAQVPILLIDPLSH